MNTYRRIVTVTLALATLTVAVGCGHHDAEQSPASFEPVSVTTATVERATAGRDIEVRGIVQPGRVADVSSWAMGPVVAINVTAGSVVTKGQGLLQIQPETTEGQNSQAPRRRHESDLLSSCSTGGMVEGRRKDSSLEM